MAVKARRRRRKARSGKRRIGRWLLLALLAIPALYLLGALVGGLVPVNRDWTEPDEGIAIFVADNGIHADLVLPVRAAGLDWDRFVDRSDARAAPVDARWIAFGMGEREIYLNTPTWADLKARTAVRALTRGERIMHVQWVRDPTYSARVITLRPEEYRRLFAAIRAGFRDNRAQLVPGRGYHDGDAFYLGVGKSSAINTCNQWAANVLRIAGVKAPLWSPFVQGLTWRYRKADQRT